MAYNLGFPKKKKKVQFWPNLDNAQYRGKFFAKNAWNQAKFEQNIGQISHCAYQNSKKWT